MSIYNTKYFFCVFVRNWMVADFASKHRSYKYDNKKCLMLNM